MLPIDDITRVGEARRLAQKVAQEAGAEETVLGRIAIVVTEVATNLARHAQNGKFIVQANAGGKRGLEIFGIDSGPGIADTAKCLVDGYSTIGTAGTGLGAIRRLADDFAVFSLPGKGTTLYARFNFEPVSSTPFRIAGISVPQSGETICGDDWAVLELSDRVRVIVADGLGHGPLAAKASQEANRVARETTTLAPAALINAQNQGMRATRGAAVMVLDISLTNGRLCTAGVGNISGFIVTPEGSRGILSHPGIVGHEMRPAQQIEFAWPQNGAVVLHSDGLSNRWNLGAYPGLLNQHPALIAATLFRDATRSRDDATVVVISRRP